MDFRSAHDAAAAIAAMHNHAFDSKHTFKVNRFTDIETYANMDETYVEPPAEEYVVKVRCFLSSCHVKLRWIYRNIFALGWPILKVAISTSLIAVKTSRFGGTENHLNVNSQPSRFVFLTS